MSQLADGNSSSRLFDRIRQIGQPKLGWDIALSTWGHAWPVYVYTSLVLSVALTIWSIVNLIGICRKRRIINRPYFIALNSMVLTFSVSRVVFLSVDPHSVRGVMPGIISNLLYNISFPTLTVGYFLTYAGLKLCTVSNEHAFTLPWILKTRFIIIFITVCFVVSLCTDMLNFLTHSTGLAIMICQLFYIVWGLIFFSLFMSLALLFKKQVQQTRAKMTKSCYRMGHCRRGFRKTHMKSVPLYVKISIFASVFTLLLVILNITRIILEFGLMTNPNSQLTKFCDRCRQEWPFFVFLCLQMAIEHLLALSLIICGSQPLKKLRVKKVFSSTVQTTANSIETTEMYSISCVASSTAHLTAQSTAEFSHPFLSNTAASSLCQLSTQSDGHHAALAPCEVSSAVSHVDIHVDQISLSGTPQLNVSNHRAVDPGVVDQQK